MTECPAPYIVCCFITELFHKQIVFLVVRKTAASAGAPKKAGGAGAAGMWRFYTEDSPGIKV